MNFVGARSWLSNFDLSVVFLLKSGGWSAFGVIFLGMMRRFFWMAIVALVGAGTLLAEPGKPTVVGIPTAQFNFVSAAQMKTEWCWAASVQMVLNWYKIPVTQADVVNRIYHKTDDLAASENQITRALSGIAYDRRGHKLQVSAVRETGIPSPSLLISQLSREHPMLLTVHSEHRMLHAVVLTSAEYVTTGTGIHVNSLTIRDPSPTFRERRGAATLRLSGEQLKHFVERISSYYVVTVRQ